MAIAASWISGKTTKELGRLNFSADRLSGQ